MMSILALDLGTTTGWAYTLSGSHATQNESAVVSGTWSLKPQRFEGGGMRFLRFREKLNELHRVSALSVIYYEEVRAHKGTDAAHVYGGLMGMLTAWCEENKVPYAGVPVAHIKKWATGKGNAKKDEVIAAVASFGYTPADDNEADAIALLLLKLQEGA